MRYGWADYPVVNLWNKAGFPRFPFKPTILNCARLGQYLLCLFFSAHVAVGAEVQPLPKIRVAKDGHGFVTGKRKPFVPFGVSYYRPGTGWAPQVWKQFDAEVTRRDYARMKELGVNCVRVFLSYGSFYHEPGILDTNGLAKFDQFLAIAEEAGIRVHPTGARSLGRPRRRMASGRDRG